MLEFARLSIVERAPYLIEVANRRRLSPIIVEKDFWVCFTLQLLFATPELADKFVFKGGTSLSKVFGIIKRFSEDVDLSVDPDWLGFGGEKSPEAAKSRAQFDKRWPRTRPARRPCRISTSSLASCATNAPTSNLSGPTTPPPNPDHCALFRPNTVLRTSKPITSRCRKCSPNNHHRLMISCGSCGRSKTRSTTEPLGINIRAAIHHFQPRQYKGRPC